MNDDQLKHVASVFNLMAFAEFGAFGYAAINADPVVWGKLALAAAGFINLQWFAYGYFRFSRTRSQIMSDYWIAFIIVMGVANLAGAGVILYLKREQKGHRHQPGHG